MICIRIKYCPDISSLEEVHNQFLITSKKFCIYANSFEFLFEVFMLKKSKLTRPANASINKIYKVASIFLKKTLLFVCFQATTTFSAKATTLLVPVRLKTPPLHQQNKTYARFKVYANC